MLLIHLTIITDDIEMCVQVLGLVENMSSFTCPNCGHKTDIFGREGAKKMAKEMQLATLGEVPLHLSIRETSDSGQPIVVSQPDSPQVSHYCNICLLFQFQVEMDGGHDY